MQHTNASLRRRLLDAEEKFLAVLPGRNDNTLETFEREWDALCLDFEKALEGGAVDDDLWKLAQSIFARVAIVGDDLARLHLQATEKTTAVMSEIEDLLSHMSIEDIVEPAPLSQPVSVSRHSSRTPVGDRLPSSSLPSCIPQAYEWILENLHNPYPPKPLKSSMASQAGVTLRSMDDWFKALRRHIGWVSFVKRHFKGSRALAIAAAERVLSQDGGDANIPFEIAADFLAIRSKLANLYPEQFPHKRSLSSAPRASLSVNSSSPPPSPAQSSGTRASSVSISTELSEPPLSSPSTRAPSLVFASSDSEDDDHPSLLAGVPSCAPLLEDVDCRPFKRLRISDEQADSFTLFSDVSEPIVVQDTRSLSSIAEPDWWSTYVQDIPAIALTTTPSPTPAIASKKRRRLGEDIAPPAKRTRNDRQAPGGKKPKAVSNHPQTRHNDLVFDYENLFKNDGSGLSFDLRFYPLLDFSSSAQAKSGGASIESDARTSDIANFEGDNAPPILDVLSSTSLGHMPPPADTDVSDATPEALQEMLDNFLATLTSGALLPADEDGTSSSLQFSLMDCEPAPNRSADLTLEQRREFDLFLSSTESPCPHASTRASFPQPDKDYGRDMFDPSILPVPDPPPLPRFLALDSCVSFDLDT